MADKAILHVETEVDRGMEAVSALKQLERTKNKAVLLVETKPGRCMEAVSTLKQLEGVKSADPVTGPYDVIAIVGGETLADIGDLVTRKINSIPCVSRSVTCICLHCPLAVGW